MSVSSKSPIREVLPSAVDPIKLDSPKDDEDTTKVRLDFVRPSFNNKDGVEHQEAEECSLAHADDVRKFYLHLIDQAQDLVSLQAGINILTYPPKSLAGRQLEKNTRATCTLRMRVL